MVLRGETIYDSFPANFPKIEYCGYFDKESEGLPLLSNDGVIASCTEKKRIYYGKRIRKWLFGKNKHLATIRLFKRSIEIEDWKTLPARVRA